MFGQGVSHGLLTGAAVAVCSGIVGSASVADVDIELIALTPVVAVGEAVAIEVVITSTTGSNRLVSAAQVIFEWDPQQLQLLGLSQVGAVPLLLSAFPADPYGINESNPPQNGLGLYQAWAPLGNPVAATPRGTLLTTLIFEALEPASPAAVDVLSSAGNPTGYTIVYDGTTPNTNITGQIIGTEITIVAACPADLTGDGMVGVPDLLALLSAWGDCPPVGEGECPADFTGSGAVGVPDLLLLLSEWGPCP